MGWRVEWGGLGFGRGFELGAWGGARLGFLVGELALVCRCGCGVLSAAGAVRVGASVVVMVTAKLVPGVVLVAVGVGVGGGGVVIQVGVRQGRRQAVRVGLWGESDSARLLLGRGLRTGGRLPLPGSSWPR